MMSQSYNCDFFCFLSGYFYRIIVIQPQLFKDNLTMAMENKNIGMIVVFVLAIIIGFISMVTSAMASSDVRSAQDALGQLAKDNDDLNEAHKTATLSAVLQGVVLGLILIGLLIYLLYKKGGDIQSGLQDARGQISTGFGAAQQWYNQPSAASGGIGGVAQ